ncbi:MAG: DUF2244 domain-containing protein [Pseudomonadota bacterium]
MPVEWLIKPETASEISGAASFEAGDAPLAEAHLWPYRSLPRRGFVLFIAITVALISVPLISVLGTPVLWGVLPFLAITVGGVWLAIERSYKDGAIVEELRVWSDHIALIRHDPRKAMQEWSANAYWADVHMHETKGPVPHYVTLKGSDREVEIGAFLSEDERKTLYRDVLASLRIARKSNA